MRPNPEMRVRNPGIAERFRRHAWLRVMATDRVLGRWLDRGQGRRLALALALAAAFLAVAAVRLYPFVDDVTPDTAKGEDWLHYKRGALSILHDGWTMPVVAEAYFRPAGFFYNYFVAAVFATLGENSAYVYLTQAALLGASIGVMYLTFRSRLAPGGGLVYLVLSILFLGVDMFWKYTVRLLSENLLLFWLPLCHYTLLRALDNGRPRNGLTAGVFLGLAAGTRPNTLLLVPGMSALLAMLGPGSVARRLRTSVALLLGAAVILAVIPIRDYAVTGQIGVRVVTDTQDWRLPTTATPGGPAPFGAAWVRIQDYARGALYCLGFLFVAGAKYSLMPHWIVMWGCAALFGVASLRVGRLASWEILALGVVLLYLVPLVSGAQVTSYGVRMIVPVVPTVLLLAVQGVAERLSGRAGATVETRQLRPRATA